MSAEFIDSNVFVYLFDAGDPARQATSRNLVSSLIRSHSGAISFQVVQEVLNVITGKLATPVQPHDARTFLDDVLRPLWRVYPSSALYHRALDLRLRYGFSFYDSLTVAAALSAGCTTLHTEDLHAGQRIEGLTVVNPFAT